jgi:hypothetical protein
LVLRIQIHDPAHQSLDAACTAFLQQTSSRGRRFDELHAAIAGVTHPTH